MSTATLERGPQLFDWEGAEAQFAQDRPADEAAQAANYTRPPESEIYGRSLSSMLQLGILMIYAQSWAEIINSPEAAQLKIEFLTSVREGLGTDGEIGARLEVRDFDVRPVVDGRVMSKDGKRAVSDMTEAGLRCAEETVKKDEHFLPQFIRSIWDHKNALIVDSMARGETGYNTRIVASPFPQEAAARPGGDAYWRRIGYVPHLKRGFVQLYHTTNDGTVLTGSLSFDGSNRERLRAVFSQFGVEVPAGEVTDNWLQYALTANLSEDQATELATALADAAGDSNYKKSTNTVDVTVQHEAIMERVFNESYVHACESLARGYQTEGVRAVIYQLANQAGNFNARYRSALYRMRANPHEFGDDEMVVVHELLAYATIEMMRALHLSQIALQKSSGYGQYHSVHNMPAQLLTTDSSAFQSMLSGFGADGARNNRGYSACGTEIFAGKDGVNDGSPQSAFGGADKDQDNAGEGSSGKKHMNCPFCGARVYDDPCARVLACWDCRAQVVDGRVVSKGNGGSRARLEARRIEERKRRAERQKAKEALVKRTHRTVGNVSMAAAKAEKASQVGRQVAQVTLTS